MAREIISYVRIDGPTSTLVNVDNSDITNVFAQIPVIYFSEQANHKLRLLHSDGLPYSVAELAIYTGFDFAIAEDYNGTTIPPVRTQAGWALIEESWTNTAGVELTGGVITIPIDANTTELETLLATEPYVYDQDDSPLGKPVFVGTELLGFVAPEVEPSLIVQYPFIFRNRRITSETPPGTVGVDYLTPAQIDANYLSRSASNVDTGALLNADDYFPVYNKDTGLSEKYKISDIATGVQTPPVQNAYVDLTAMFAGQGNQNASYFQKAGSLYYEYLGTTTGDITDYNAVGGGEVEEAPEDGKQYGREDATWTEIIGGSGDMTKSIYDPASIEEQVVGETATQTLTNKSLTAVNITDYTDYTPIVGSVPHEKGRIYYSED
jgi:hypothetical protein